MTHSIDGIPMENPAEASEAENTGPKYPDVEVQLTGEDGNAFTILGRIQKAMHRADIPNTEYRAFELAATEGDYGHLLRTARKWVKVP